MKFLILTAFISLFSVSFSLPVAIRSRDDLTSRKAPASTAKASPAKVQQAADNFATDATTVSASLNSLGSATDPKKIKSLASTAFTAESDEDAQRSVLNAAAGSAGVGLPSPP